MITPPVQQSMLLFPLVVKENLSAMVLSLAKRAAREILAMDTIYATKSLDCLDSAGRNHKSIHNSEELGL
jgi:hypothetical protein